MLDDALSSLLKQFRVSASVFQQGNYCGGHTFTELSKNASQALVNKTETGGGHIHLVLEGELEILHDHQVVASLDGPSLVIYPRGRQHSIQASGDIVLVCADVEFEGGISHPLINSLPEYMVASDADLPCLSPLIKALQYETINPDARPLKACTDRMLEIIIIYLLRKMASESKATQGLLAALQDERIARVLHQIFAKPGDNWNVEKMAAIAYSARSTFGEVFKTALDQSPMDFLRSYRLQIVANRLKQGASVAHLADELGYSDTAALSKAFKKAYGKSPKAYAFAGG